MRRRVRRRAIFDQLEAAPAPDPVPAAVEPAIDIIEHAPRSAAAGAYLLALTLLLAVLLPAFGDALSGFIAGPLVLLAAALLIFAVVHRGFRLHLKGLPLALVAATLALPLLQLVPLPFELWANLAGRAFYADALRVVGSDAETARPLSLIPQATWQAWLGLMPPLAILLAGLALSTGRLRSLVIIVLTVAAGESVLALIQFMGADAADWVGVSASTAVSGTLADRHQLSGLLVMVLPLALALLMATIGRTKDRELYKSAMHGFVAAPLTAHVNRAALYAVVVVLLIVGIVATRSPLGLRLCMAVLALGAVAFAGRLGGVNVFGWRGSLGAFAVCVGIMLVLSMLLDRLTITAPGDVDWAVFASVSKVTAEFMPWGSGFGTFADIYPRFQPDEVLVPVVLPSGDLLGWLLAGGAGAAVLLLLAIVCYLRQWWWLWQFEVWSTVRFVQVGAGIGLLLTALNGAFDAGLHRPANAIYCAFIAALFLQRPHEKKRKRSRVRRRDRLGGHRKLTRDDDLSDELT